MSNILLGVTGGISAYKAADLIGALKKFDHVIRVIMTNRAKDFITPLTLATLSKHPVYDDAGEWAPTGRIDHIELPEWADIFLIAPATANTIAKLAQGIGDNLLTSAYLAFNYSRKEKKLAVICPAMNTYMWYSPETQKNTEVLQKKVNHYIIEPVEGLLACGAYGIGKLAPTKTIVDIIQELCKWES